MKDYYALLEVPATASAEDVKRAFRLQIARYHPDKVQHLGKEFQAMAAGRAAELTEAYRILSDQARRTEYDHLRSSASGAAPASAPAPPPVHHETEAPGQPAPSFDAPPTDTDPARSRATEERAARDEFVRKAVISRFKQVFAETIGGDYDTSQLRGFDVAYVPKSKMFGRKKGPRLLGRFVPRVDADAVTDTWQQAGKWPSPSNDDVCVFLMGSGTGPLRELADAIAKQRRVPSRGGKVTLIPIDARVWDAHMPTDAPAVAKDLLARLRGGR